MTLTLPQVLVFALKNLRCRAPVLALVVLLSRTPALYPRGMALRSRTHAGPFDREEQEAPGMRTCSERAFVTLLVAGPHEVEDYAHV